MAPGEPFIIAHFEGVVVFCVFLLGAVGTFIGWQLRIIHKRIDKYSEKMDKHIEDGQQVLSHMAVMERLHDKNGDHH